MKPTLQLKLGQQLTMTPQLQQAIRLLQLPVLELNAQLEQALAENLMLEAEDFQDVDTVAEPGEAAEAAEASEAGTDEVVAGDGLDLDSWGETSGEGSWSGEDNRPEPADRSGDSLREHLLWQLQMEHFTDRERVIGEAIIDAINESGYLEEPLEGLERTLAARGRFSPEEIAAALVHVQQLDPAGVGARNLSECLTLQLGQLDPGTPGLTLALEITASALDLVAEQEFGMLRRRLEASAEDLEEALALIRACHPKPGLALQSSAAEYIVPDVYVRRRDGQWVVELNRALAPRLRVNQAYAELVRGESEHAVLRGQLQEARWLVKSLEIRHDTILKVAMCIVERQSDFLQRGEEGMRPMVLRDVAEAVGMHESTISRVTAGKYMHTPRGVYEFRYFFSSQVGGGSDPGEEQSSVAVRARIRRLIADEDPARPLSDSRIAELLATAGTHVARRTVAKYREALGIASSSDRRRRPAR
ncbi:MAG: RNA polymerase factor sigma-54 [Chromatiales bacterium]|nr:RNA polymerase factor sigma-54 [Chromatiales bacterium]